MIVYHSLCMLYMVLYPCYVPLIWGYVDIGFILDTCIMSLALHMLQCTQCSVD